MSSEERNDFRESSIERAWSHVFLKAVAHPSCELAPFTMTIASDSGLVLPDTLTHPLVRALDACLGANNKRPVEEVAFPLFPERVWRFFDPDRHEFYAEYLRDQPTYVSWEPHKNQGGTYFGRLIGFGVHHKTRELLPSAGSSTLGREGNQIEHVIRRCQRSVELGRRVPRMQLQATTFDPFRDLTLTGQPKFPCLQHLTFDLDVRAGTLAMNAFYATQKLFVKAFGNWLGLCRLGRFVAGQSGLRLSRFTCFVGVQKMDDAPRRGAERDSLIRAAEAIMGKPVESERLVTANVS
ncbi:hypothetical protein [Tautonia rosea]|uniref:hypothetical protein n=1 Tax=Tautonia rosea TaxID=2728037 RepID=UPI001475265F|nr:hypothetical protein [Tautonia rosea]